MQLHEQLLIALRQVIRAIDLHSKKLNRDAGLTAPQLIILRCIEAEPGISPKQVAIQVNLSQGTITTILDRLQSRELIIRKRSELDRRSWQLNITRKGKTLLDQAPTPLQQDFIERFNALQTWEQQQILTSVQRIASMMNAESIDAAPLLELGTINRSAADTPRAD
jgi:DNA-binding MarR family transcriptional regulator